MNFVKITILGCDASYPSAGGACSGYLLETDGKKVLIDCGSGIMSNLQKCCKPEELDCILISHLHEDHKADLHTLRYALDAKERKGLLHKKVDIYLPGNPESDYKAVTNKMEDSFEVHELHEDTIVKLGDMEVSFMNAAHPITTFSMKFKQGNLSIVYTGDSAPNPALLGFCQGSDVIIGDATYLKNNVPDNNKYHMTAEQVGILGKKAGANLTILSHLDPENDLKDYKKEIAYLGGDKLAIAEIGMSIEVGKEKQITTSQHSGFTKYEKTIVGCR